MQSGGMYPGPQLLVHLCPASDWVAAGPAGQLRPESLSTVGFVHLSTPEQVHLPANRIFAGRRDLLLLHLDPAALQSPLRWEPGLPQDPPGMRFPHLYGPVPTDAVVTVVRYLPDPDGIFPPIA